MEATLTDIVMCLSIIQYQHDKKNQGKSVKRKIKDAHLENSKDEILYFWKKHQLLYRIEPSQPKII